MMVKLKAATPELKQLSTATNMVGRAVKTIFRFADRNIWSAIAAFLTATALSGLSMLLFRWLSQGFHDAGIPVLGGLMTLIFVVMGIVTIGMVVFGKWWILFRG